MQGFDCNVYAELSFNGYTSEYIGVDMPKIPLFASDDPLKLVISEYSLVLGIG